MTLMCRGHAAMHLGGHGFCTHAPQHALLARNGVGQINFFRILNGKSQFFSRNLSGNLPKNTKLLSFVFFHSEQSGSRGSQALGASRDESLLTLSL